MNVKWIDTTLKKKMRAGEGGTEKPTVQSADGGSPGANAGGEGGRGSSSVHVRVFQLNIAAGPARRPMYFDEMVST